MKTETGSLFVCPACNAMVAREKGAMSPCICKRPPKYVMPARAGFEWFVWRLTPGDARFLRSLRIAAGMFL